MLMFVACMAMLNTRTHRRGAVLSCAVSCRAFAVAGDDVGLCDGRVFAISYAVVLCVLPQCLFDGLDSIFSAV